MTPIEHLNKFCEKFGALRTLKSQGKLQTKPAQILLMEMVEHYWEFDDKMEAYVSKWKFELVDLGFYIKLHCPEYPDEKIQPDNIDVSDIETEYKAEEFDKDYLIFRKDVAYKDKSEVTVANYCRHSTPWSLLGDDYQKELIQRIKENIKNEELGRRDPQSAKKKSYKRMRKTPMKWTIPDNQRDW